MKLFVQVTFDLEDARKPEYLAIESWLNSVGLTRTITGPNGTPLRLPSNTFAGVRDCYSSPAAAIKHVKEQFEMSAQWNSCEGSAFISAGPVDTTEYGSHQFGL